MKHRMNLILRSIVTFFFISVPYCARFSQEEANSPVVINEFMAKNTSTNPLQTVDEYGEADDWIELYNPEDTPVSLEGLYLSDNPTSLRKYALFDTILPPHGYALVWADGQPEQGEHHAKFKLSSTNGDQIILSGGRGQIIDSVQFLSKSGNPEARLPDQSYGRSTDGEDGWCQQKLLSPLAENAGCLK